jgi:CheY-like chemotaxis protein
MVRLSEKGKPPATAGRKTTGLEFQTAGLPKGAKAMTISVLTSEKVSETGEAWMSEIRALIVDDQRTMRKIVRGLLGQAGIKDVVEAEDGAVALRFLEAQQADLPDIVICDLHMEKVDGMDFCNRIRRHKRPEIAGIPVLILTGDADTMLHEVSRQVGAAKVLTKPISAPDLAREIHEAVGFSG